MKRNSKALQAARANFKRTALEFLNGLGAMKVHRSYYDLSIPTPIGDLDISIGENCIHQCFRNDFAGEIFLNQRFSSKWNFLYTDDVATLGCAYAHLDWQMQIERLLEFKPTPEFWAKARQRKAEYDAKFPGHIDSDNERELATLAGATSHAS